MLKVGETILKVTFSFTAQRWQLDSNPVRQNDFAGKKIVLLLCPGACYPTCSESHLTRLCPLVDSLKRKGV